MLKTLLLSGTLLLTSTGLSLGAPSAQAPAAAGKTFALTVPSAPPPGRAIPHPANHTVLRAQDGLFYVTATVNGKAVRFIVDTGSNVVVLTKRDAARIGLSREATAAVALQTVGGAAAMQRGSVDRLVVAGQSLDNVDAATVDSGLEISLLGQSALSRLQSLRFAGDRLELN